MADPRASRASSWSRSANAWTPSPVGRTLRGVEAFVQKLVLRLRLGFPMRIPGVVDTGVRRVFAFMPFMPLANITGASSMTVPRCWNRDGLLVGLMFTAPFGGEATLIRLAAELEARPWRDRRPPISADTATEN